MQYAPVISLSILIFVASAQERAPIPDFGFTWQDKVFHFLAYLVYALTVYNAVRLSSITEWRRAMVILAVSALYGAADEWHQFYVPGRSSELLDWVADVLGASVVSITVLIRARAKGKRL